MKADLQELEKYPKIMSKEQLCKACHISKRTALFLLRNDLIPHTDTGKLTRCYRIRRSDVIDFVKKQNLAEQRNRLLQIRENIRSVCSEAQLSSDPIYARKIFANKAAQYHDVMNLDEVSEFLGYHHRTISSWIHNGKLMAFKSRGVYMVPKIFLLDFITSSAFNSIVRKTPKHAEMLQDLMKKTRQGRKEAGNDSQNGTV